MGRTGKELLYALMHHLEPGLHFSWATTRSIANMCFSPYSGGSAQICSRFMIQPSEQRCQDVTLQNNRKAVLQEQLSTNDACHMLWPGQYRYIASLRCDKFGRNGMSLRKSIYRRDLGYGTDRSRVRMHVTSGRVPQGGYFLVLAHSL